MYTFKLLGIHLNFLEYIYNIMVNKEHVIVSRVNDANLEQIERITKITGEKKSSIVRSALQYYLYIKLSHIPIILWGRNEFAYTLNCMNDSQIKVLADLSHKNGIEDFYQKNNSIWLETEFDGPFEKVIPVQIFLDFFLKYTLSPQLLNFFDSIEWKWIEKKRRKLRITGNHTNNENFSKYIKYVLENYLIMYDYSLSREVLLDDLMIIEFSKKTTK